MTQTQNQRSRAVTSFHVMRLLARARELEAAGRDIIHMEIGEPDFPTPAPIVHAAQHAIATGKMHYTPATGLPALKQRLAQFYQERYGVTVAPHRIVITPGASGALLLALAATLDVNDELLMTDPGYPCNRNMTVFLGARARGIAVGPETNYQLTAAQLHQNWTAQTRAVLLASPSNPTGSVIDIEELAAMAREVVIHQGVLLVDEIYHGLLYDTAARSVLEVTQAAFVINSFSKYFGMTGWRLGWMVVPECYLDAIDRFAQNIYLAAPTPSQYAALAAFEPETIAILEQRRAEFQRRRDYLLPELQKLGFDIPVTPSGAFYIYGSCARFSHDSLDLCETLLEQAGVAITPGIDFGQHQANTQVRFAYTTSLDKLQEGVRRLQEYFQPANCSR